MTTDKSVGLAAAGWAACFWAGVAILAVSGIGSHQVAGADLHWSGDGTWNETSQIWGTAPGGPYDQAIWSNTTPDSATFEGTGGTVTLAESITAGTLAFGNGSGTYTLVGDDDCGRHGDARRGPGWNDVRAAGHRRHDLAAGRHAPLYSRQHA